MDHLQPRATGGGRRSGDRGSGVALGVASLLSVALMAHHPSVGAVGMAGALQEIAREAWLSRGVHGGLIALVAVLVFAFAGLSGVLGWRRRRVRAGMIAYALGAVCTVGAALVNGFVVPALAARSVGALPGRLETWRPVFRLCWEVNQTLTATGVWGVSLAIASWSLVLLGRGGWARLIGGVGIVLGVFPLAGLLVGRLSLDVHGMGAVVLSQAAWNVAVAWWWLRSAPLEQEIPGSADRRGPAAT